MVATNVKTHCSAFCHGRSKELFPAEVLQRNFVPNRTAGAAENKGKQVGIWSADHGTEVSSKLVEVVQNYSKETWRNIVLILHIWNAGWIWKESFSVRGLLISSEKSLWLRRSPRRSSTFLLQLFCFVALSPQRLAVWYWTLKRWVKCNRASTFDGKGDMTLSDWGIWNVW